MAFRGYGLINYFRAALFIKEITNEKQVKLESRYRTTAIIVFSQMFSTLVLIFLFWFVVEKTENSVSQQTLTTLWVGAIFVAVGTFVLRRMFFRWDRLKDIVLLKGVSGLLRTLQTNAIILAALAEAIAIIGMVIAFLSGEPFDMLRAGFVALIVFLINFPRKSVWEKIAAKMREV